MADTGHRSQQVKGPGLSVSFHRKCVPRDSEAICCSREAKAIIPPKPAVGPGTPMYRPSPALIPATSSFPQAICDEEETLRGHFLSRHSLPL